MALELYVSHVLDTTLSYAWGHWVWITGLIADDGTSSKSLQETIFCYIEPGKKFAPHWHTDREEIFYCVEGTGMLYLDTIKRRIGPGDAMYIGLRSYHTIVNDSDETFKYFVYGLPKTKRTPVKLEKCIVNVDDVKETEYFGAKAREIFGPQYFGTSSQTEWFGEIEIGPAGKVERHQIKNSEERLYFRKGEGLLRLLGEQKEIGPGHIARIPSNAEYEILNRGAENMKIVIIRTPVEEEKIPLNEHF